VCCTGITVVLSLTFFQTIITNKVPESSSSVPLIGTLRNIKGNSNYLGAPLLDGCDFEISLVKSLPCANFEVAIASAVAKILQETSKV